MSHISVPGKENTNWSLYIATEILKQGSEALTLDDEKGSTSANGTFR